jgi:hypothetical protein
VGDVSVCLRRPALDDTPETCVVFLLGYPRVGKRTVGSHLAGLLDGVPVDNALLSIALLTLFKWDGKFPTTMAIWERVGLVREVVLGTDRGLGSKAEQLRLHGRVEGVRGRLGPSTSASATLLDVGAPGHDGGVGLTETQRGSTRCS